MVSKSEMGLCQLGIFSDLFNDFWSISPWPWITGPRAHSRTMAWIPRTGSWSVIESIIRGPNTNPSLSIHWTIDLETGYTVSLPISICSRNDTSFQWPYQCERDPDLDQRRVCGWVLWYFNCILCLVDRKYRLGAISKNTQFNIAFSSVGIVWWKSIITDLRKLKGCELHKT